MKKHLLIALGLGVALLSPAAAMAADADHAGHYVGVKIGNAHSNVSNNDVGGNGFDDNDVGAGLFGGYRFNKNWAVEAGWDYLGNHDFDVVGGGNGKIRMDALHLVGVGIYPINDTFEVYGKLGVAATYTKVHVSGLGGDGERDIGYVVGLGGSYWVNANVEVRGEWTRTDDLGVNARGNVDGEVDYIGVGTAWHF